MFTGVDDTNCSPESAERIFNAIGTQDKSLTIIDKVDATEENGKAMDHSAWTAPLSQSNLQLIVNALGQTDLEAQIKRRQEDEESS